MGSGEVSFLFVSFRQHILAMGKPGQERTQQFYTLLLHLSVQAYQVPSNPPPANAHELLKLVHAEAPVKGVPDQVGDRKSDAFL